jgi:hypothetical protein
MGTAAQNLIRDILHYQVVDLNLEYATQVLDKNHTGLISIQQIPHDPLLGQYLVSSSPYVLADLYAWLEAHSGFTHILLLCRLALPLNK